MKAERWQKIDELFHAALAHEGEGRATFLREACAGDEKLRREVESLIAAHEWEGSFIDSPAFVVAPEPAGGDQAELPVGRQVGRYEVLSLLGRGGMGEVYLARDARLGRLVALKLIPPSLALDKDRLGRFEREARAASALNHPNVCTIYEVGETDEGRHYITMEYVEGVTLRQQMNDRQMMKLAEVLDVGAQIASALAAAHAAGVIHRDIKPENILLRHDRLVKVLDFGLAKLIEQQQPFGSEAPTRAKVRTRTGVVMGTVSYMSPEQARGLEVDARTDIWSLGVVLYEMVAGRTPFQGETDSDQIVSILEREPPPVVRFAPDVPQELGRIITKALRKDSEERYQSVKDLGLDLRSLKGELEFAEKLERSAPPERSAEGMSMSGGAHTAGVMTSQATAPVGTAQTAPPAGETNSEGLPRAGKIVSLFRRNRWRSIFILSGLLTAGGAAFITYRPDIQNRFGQAGSPPPEIIPSTGTNERSATRPQARTLAVLPFRPVVEEGRDEALELGMADTLIARLSNLREVIVRPVSSVRRYSGLEQDPLAAGRELAVDAVLDAQMQRAGERIRVTVRLVRVADGSALWADRFDEKFTDVFAVQDAIAEKRVSIESCGNKLRL